MGLADDQHFAKYHRVLNRDRWAPWVLSKLLLRLIIVVFLPPEAVLVLFVDETLERRGGRKIKYKGWFRDAIRSTAKQVTKALGIRWMLVHCPEDSFRPEAFFCSHTDVSARKIVTWFITRWNIEVTFEEQRAHLGFETQRQWSDKAIERTTPCLFGIFSLALAGLRSALWVMANGLHAETLLIRQASWYPKQEAAFSDV